MSEDVAEDTSEDIAEEMDDATDDDKMGKTTEKNMSAIESGLLNADEDFDEVFDESEVSRGSNMAKAQKDLLQRPSTQALQGSHGSALNATTARKQAESRPLKHQIKFPPSLAHPLFDIHQTNEAIRRQ